MEALKHPVLGDEAFEILIYLTTLPGYRVELHRIRASSQSDVWEEMRKEMVFSEILTQRGRIIPEKLIVP